MVIQGYIYCALKLKDDLKQDSHICLNRAPMVSPKKPTKTAAEDVGEGQGSHDEADERE